MDVVVEVFDTFLFDRLYATLLPASYAQYPQYATPKTTPNGTYSSMREVPTPYASTYQYRPASEYLSFQPGEYAYMSRWPRDNIFRQAVTLYLITWIFGLVIYFFCATFSYLFIFDKATFNHPKYLKNQMRMEIAQSMVSMPIMAIFTVPMFLLEVRGYSRMYDSTAEGPGMWYNILQFPLFITFTDFFIYWIHRALHHPLIYKRLHKPHHKWIMPTPYASHAFHPLDGYAQSVPYHVFPFIFPLQKFAYIALFTFINVWTVMIHDGEYVADSPIINGAACHTMHHLYFNYNYGQFTTLWDRLGGSYRKPNEELFRRETKMGKEEWGKQAREMERIAKEVEGEDDRVYVKELESKKVQ
ncbi:C-5 sterol desaturase [Coniosporium apollinis CBS 100218]|uniref:C-5 sterol desaturase n=1 Tax=Coniosporium apollinis (strain CBS 100218) TaxID=1168221 RepID=R7YVK0_CONA1|nr:C-5 sterol desaturase [Coniosporium apollinis CBS 100218]EON65873.1 C-5 sterol desaturase [Coniosporium apollinis CBS 100218]